MSLSKVLVAYAQALGNARPEAFDHDIGAIRQLPDSFLPFGRLEVEHHALLAPVPLDGSGPIAEGIATRGLDLYDLGPEV